MRKVKAVSETAVKNYVEVANLCRGTRLFDDFALAMEFKDIGTRWTYDGYTLPGSFVEGCSWYIKAVNGVYLLYRLQGSVEIERYHLKPTSIKFFNL